MDKINPYLSGENFVVKDVTTPLLMLHNDKDGAVDPHDGG